MVRVEQAHDPSHPSGDSGRPLGLTVDESNGCGQLPLVHSPGAIRVHQIKHETQQDLVIRSAVVPDAQEEFGEIESPITARVEGEKAPPRPGRALHLRAFKELFEAEFKSH